MLTTEESIKLAIANNRMNKGLEQLSSNWINWKKTLSNANRTTADYVNVINEMTPAIRELIGASEDFELPEGFLDVKANLTLIEEAASGSTKAIQKLGVEITKVQVEQWAQINSSLELEGGIKWSLGADEFETNKDIILQGLTELQDKIEKGLAVGADAMSGEWVTAMNEMALATGMSVEEMNAMLSQMGVSANVNVTNVETKVKVP